MMKPNKNIYNRLFEKYELIPEECLFIDDSEKNILSAEECGMHGYIFDINNGAFLSVYPNLCKYSLK